MPVNISSSIKKIINNEKLFSEIENSNIISIEKSIYRDYIKLSNIVKKEFPDISSSDLTLQAIKTYLLMNFNISTDFTEYAVCQGKMVNICESTIIDYASVTPFKLLVNINEANQLVESWKLELIKIEKLMKVMKKKGIPGALDKYENAIENLTYNLNNLSEAVLNKNKFVEIYIPIQSDYSKISFLERNILETSYFELDKLKHNNSELKSIEINIKKEHEFIQSGIKNISELDPTMVDFNYIVVNGLRPKELEKKTAEIIKNKILIGTFELLIDKIISAGNLDSVSVPLMEHQVIYGKKLLSAISSLEKAPKEVRELINAKINLKISSDKLGDYIKQDYERKLVSLSNEKNSAITSTGLTDMENQLITLIDDSRDRKLTELEKNIVIEFLEETLGNKNRNSRFRKSLGKNTNALFRIKHEDTIEQLAYLSHKIKKDLNHQMLTDKVTAALYKISKNEALTHNDKISIKDLGHLSNLAKVHKYLIKLDSTDAISSSEKLLHLYKSSEQAIVLINQINDIFKKEQQYQDGDILMYNSSKENLYKMKRNDTESFLRENLISQYGHAAQIFFDEDGVARVSHIYGSYQKNELLFAEAMHSDIFRFDPTSLLSQAACDAAIKKWGVDWKDEVREIYRKSQSKLHNESSDMFEEIKNSKNARFDSGKADFIPFGHSTTDKNDFELLRDKMYKNGDNYIDTKIMICSEFVTKATIAGIVETNDILKDLIGVDNSLQIPFNEHEDLKKVHTGRLIKKLIQSGSLTKLRRHKIENYLIKESETSNIRAMIRMSQVIETEIRNIHLDDRQQVTIEEKKKFLKNIINYVKNAHNKYNPDDKIDISDDFVDKIFHTLSSNIDSLIDKTVLHNDKQLRKKYIVRFSENFLSVIKNFFLYHTDLTRSLEKDLSSMKSTIIFENLNVSEHKPILDNSDLTQRSKENDINGLLKACVQSVECLISERNNNSNSKAFEFGKKLQEYVYILDKYMKNLHGNIPNDNKEKNIQELLEVASAVRKFLIDYNSNDVLVKKKSFLSSYKSIVPATIDENIIQDLVNKLNNMKI